MPARGRWRSASARCLGLVAYGTYDITNLATLRDWPVAVTVIDLAWGTALSARAALSGYTALRTTGMA